MSCRLASGLREAIGDEPPQAHAEPFIPGGEHGLLWHFMRVTGRAFSKSRFR